MSTALGTQRPFTSLQQGKKGRTALLLYLRCLTAKAKQISQKNSSTEQTQEFKLQSINIIYNYQRS